MLNTNTEFVIKDIARFLHEEGLESKKISIDFWFKINTVPPPGPSAQIFSVIFNIPGVFAFFMRTNNLGSSLFVKSGLEPREQVLGVSTFTD